ncbi:Npt1/Npt2 family nucleotide transporter [Pendulispora albinea]|uniref:ADP,ATP carrier protein n=1 Tax=Pendulispora albinea TaxID=2741071 RepID=A0ABZ2LR74_9BACT
MSERAPTLDASIAIAVIAQQVGGKVVRDSMFLSSFPAASLPSVIAASAVLSLLAVLVTSRFMAKRGPGRVVPVLFVLNALALLAEWTMASALPGASAVLVYVHTSAVGGLMISGFWSIVNERFDPHVARRNIVRVTTGATLGGLVGGLGAERVADMFDPHAILLMLAALSLSCAWGVAALGRSLPRSPGPSAPAFRDGMKALGQRPYLRRVVSMVVAVALLEIFLDCALKTAAESSYHEPRALVSFFALFHTATGLLTFFVQVALSRASLERLGLGGTLAILPAAVIVSALAASGMRTLLAIAVAAGLETAIASSLFRSAYEILFTPLPTHRKRALKVVIDVAFPRLGNMLGSAAVALVVGIAAGPRHVSVALLFGAAALGVLGLVWGISLHRMYVTELGTSLQLGIVTLRQGDVRDATTRHTILSTMALDRARLLAQIEASRRGDPGKAPSDPSSAERSPAFAKLAARAEGTSDTLLFDVLLGGLRDDDFDVSYANARALAAICARNPALPPDRARILDEARAALFVDDGTWRARKALGSDSSGRTGLHRGLEHVFTLLGMVLERDVIKGCLAALQGPDRRLRGTVLEYLENALPNDIGLRMRERIQEHFAEAEGER